MIFQLSEEREESIRIFQNHINLVTQNLKWIQYKRDFKKKRKKKKKNKKKS